MIGRLALPLTLVLASCAVEIVHDLEEPEANQLLASLQQHGIPAEKSRSVQGSTASYSLRVPSGQASKAWRVMREQNLPRPKRLGLGEVFAKPSLVPTATQERALLHHALGEEIAKTLQSVEGVVEARVHLVLPVRDPLAPGDAPRPAPRASALVRATAPAPIAREEVQRLVAGAVDGLKPEDVTVVIVTGARPAPAAASAELARLGPFLVAEGSASALKLTLIAAFALVGLLALGVVIALARQRALARRLAAAEPSAPPPSDTFSRHVDSSLGLIGRSLSRRPPADEGSRAKQ